MPDVPSDAIELILIALPARVNSVPWWARCAPGLAHWRGFAPTAASHNTPTSAARSTGSGSDKSPVARPRTQPARRRVVRHLAARRSPVRRTYHGPRARRWSPLFRRRDEPRGDGVMTAVRSIAVVALLLLGWLPLFAQTTGDEIGGAVYDTSGRSIAGATILVLDLSGQRVAQVATGPDGRWLAKVSQPGALRSGYPWQLASARCVNGSMHGCGQGPPSSTHWP